MKIYILSDYQEQGAESVIATTDKLKVPDMLIALGYGKRPKAIEKLAELLEADEIDKDGTDLEDGWGGSVLHIVEDYENV